MSSTDKPSAAVPTTETTIYSAADLDQDGTLAVANNVTLALESEALFINDPTIKKDIRYCGLVTVASTASQTIPFYNILSAQIAGEALILKYAKAVVKDEYIPSTLTYTLDNQSSIAKAESWIKQLLSAAYGEAQQNKRLLVLINPQGGKGYAKELYNDYAAPMFEAAGCKVDVDITKYSGHATDIAEKLNIDEYDAILCCSGDGLPYEVLNGFAKRPNATEALAKVAVAMIPCGSGNAMAWNMFGTNSISLSALAVIKGLRLPLDLVSITQTGTRTLSFLSQSYGIIAESDLGTVHLRWMGAARFTFGFLTRLLRQTAYPCDIAFKLETADKQVMKERYLEYKKIKPTLRPVGGSGDGGVGDEIIGKGLPDLKYGTVDDELPSDWERVSTDTLSNFYAGNMAIMSADVNFFPATVPNDGLIDVVTIDGALGRLRALSMMTAVENGELFEFPEVEVRKVHGYRLTPRGGKDGYISVDGESIPFQPFQVEVHPGLGTTLSKSGHLYEAQGPI